VSKEPIKLVIDGREAFPSEVKPDWTKKCAVCGESPVVPITGLCGLCTFGEAETAEGNWV